MATIKVSTTTSGARAINYAEKRAEIKNGHNCDIENAKEEMESVRELYGKTNGTQAHLVIQSFSPEESKALGAEKINQLGMELGQQMASEHQVAVYTHVDKEHYHNHLVINSVNLETGAKYHQYKEFNHVKEINDKIALKNGLDIVKETALERKTISEIKLEEKGVTPWKQEIRHAIDNTMTDSSVTSYKRFREVLNEKCVNVYERGKDITYELLDSNNKVRGRKLGEDYQKEKIFGELERRLSVFQKEPKLSHEKPTEQEIQAENTTTMAQDAKEIRSSSLKEDAKKERKQQTKEKAEHVKKMEQGKKLATQQKLAKSMSKGMELGR